MDIIYEVEKAGRQPLHSFERQNIKKKLIIKLQKYRLLKIYDELLFAIRIQNTCSR